MVMLVTQMNGSIKPKDEKEYIIEEEDPDAPENNAWGC